jgi:hypothetical protein
MQDCIIIRDNKNPGDPVVISKRKGHPGDLLPFGTISGGCNTGFGADVLFGIVAVEGTSYLIVGTDRREVGRLRDQPVYRVSYVQYSGVSY